MAREKGPMSEKRREQKRAAARKWDAANRDKKLEVSRRCRAQKREHYKEYARHYNKKRRAEDPAFRLKNLLANRIRKAVKTNNTRRIDRTLDLVGCTIPELRLHLEKQFTGGMNWGNMGEWHIDHIKPCDMFDLSVEEEQRACFHYTNLQPLWGEENKSKGARWSSEAA